VALSYEELAQREEKVEIDEELFKGFELSDDDE
jgi:hypothetical protein